jgi:UDP-2,3-diacylglucosamine pyrophosphatase LpxH
MQLLIISDLHLGRGKFFKNGLSNILEDFFEDQRFCELLDYYSLDEYFEKEIELILNGDIFNLIQIDREGAFTHIIDEEHSSYALRQIYIGHPRFFEGIKNFLSRPNKKLTYVIGNHDAAMAFPKVQEDFRQMVGENVEFCFHREVHGVHIEHGHRFEAINTVHPKKFFLEGPGGKKILNLPWGSLFCIFVLPKLKKYRPNIDKIRPLSVYIKWCILHDFAFFLTMLRMVVIYIIRSSFNEFTRQNRNFRTTLTILKQITIYPRYGRMARKILRRKKHLSTVVMGHTHVMEWRRFPEGRYYYNSGTWNAIPSVDSSLHDSTFNLSYISIEIDTKNSKVHRASLNLWNGSWRPFREEISTN